VARSSSRSAAGIAFENRRIVDGMVIPMLFRTVVVLVADRPPGSGRSRQPYTSTMALWIVTSFLLFLVNDSMRTPSCSPADYSGKIAEV